MASGVMTQLGRMALERARRRRVLFFMVPD
jgi:hypothetical protein